MIKIERTSARVNGAKRQSAPYVTKWTCPDCGALNEVNHETHGFNYPVFGEVSTVYLFCTACDASGKSGDGDKGVTAVRVDILVSAPDAVALPLSKKLALAAMGALSAAVNGQPLAPDERQALDELAITLHEATR